MLTTRFLEAKANHGPYLFIFLLSAMHIAVPTPLAQQYKLKRQECKYTLGSADIFQLPKCWVNTAQPRTQIGKYTWDQLIFLNYLNVV